MALITKKSKYVTDQAGRSPDESFASLFHPDTLLAAQYLQQFRRKIILQPEEKLMLAVLQDAVDCFMENVSARSGRKKALLKEVEEWILAEDADEVFSFENICDVLELDCKYVRQGLLRWKENRLSIQRA